MTNKRANSIILLALLVGVVMMSLALVRRSPRGYDGIQATMTYHIRTDHSMCEITVPTPEALGIGLNGIAMACVFEDNWRDIPLSPVLIPTESPSQPSSQS